MKKKALLSCTLILGLLTSPMPSFAYREFWDGDMPCTESTYVNEEINYNLTMPITIHVDGKYLPSDVDPTMKNNRILVPLRAAGEAVGATVTWNQTSQTATATKGTRTVQFKLRNTTYYINGQAHISDVPPTVIQNRTLLPLRAFAEAFDTSVEWNQNLYDVSIDTPLADIAAPNIPSDISQKTATFIKKYYVYHDPSEPFTGSWRNIHTEITGDIFSGYRPLKLDSYKFITKTADNTYYCIDLGIEKDSNYSSEWFTITKDDEMNYYNSNYNTMIHYINLTKDNRQYYSGPNRGVLSGSEYYQIKANGLYCTDHYDNFGNRTPDEYNYYLTHPYEKF